MRYGSTIIASWWFLDIIERKQENDLTELAVLVLCQPSSEG